jgi:hypothetical protein
MNNAGTLDRTIRIVLGVGLIAVAFFGPKTPLGFVGVIPLLTGVIGFCPLYRLVGVSTCPAPKT